MSKGTGHGDKSSWLTANKAKDARLTLGHSSGLTARSGQVSSKRLLITKARKDQKEKFRLDYMNFRKDCYILLMTEGRLSVVKDFLLPNE